MVTLSKEVSKFLPIFKVWADDGVHPSVALDKAVCVIGRREIGVNLPLQAPEVSKLHALVVRTQHSVYVRDLASRNGVQRNGAPVQEVGLSDEDVLRIGSYTLRCASGFGPAENDGENDGAMDDSGIGARAAEAETMPAPAVLIAADGARYPFPAGRHTVLIGQREGCEVRLENDNDIAPVHAILFEIDGARFVRDLGAPGGTFLNQQAIHQSALSPGDEIRIGDVRLRYALVDVTDVTADEEDDEDANKDHNGAATPRDVLGVDDSAPGIDLVDSMTNPNVATADSMILPEITMEDSGIVAATPGREPSAISEYDFDVVDTDPRRESTFAGEVVGAGMNPVTAEDAKPARPELPPATMPTPTPPPTATTPQRSMDDSAIPIAGSFHDRILGDDLVQDAVDGSPISATPPPASPAPPPAAAEAPKPAASKSDAPPAEAQADNAAVEQITQLVDEVTERVEAVSEKVEMVAAKVERAAAKMSEVSKDVSEVAETAGTLQEVWSEFRNGESGDHPAGAERPASGTEKPASKVDKTGSADPEVATRTKTAEKKPAENSRSRAT